MASFIVNFANVVIDCLRHPTRNCRLSIEGEVAIGDGAHVMLPPRLESKNQNPENEIQYLQRRLSECEEVSKKLKESIDNGVRFKIVALIAMGLTLLSLATALLLGSLGQLSLQQQAIFEVCSLTWKMGVFAFLGGITGKVLTK